MGRRAGSDGVNKSQAIRDLLKVEPDIKAKDAIAKLGEQGVKITSGHYYLVKGKEHGKKQGRKKQQHANQQAAVRVAKAAGSSDIVAMLQRVKSLAGDVGGMPTLKALVDALSE